MRIGVAAILAAGSALSAQILAETITFEEPIALPDTVLLQYCNLGVEFLDVQRIFDPGQLEPPLATSSSPNALTNFFPGDEFGFLNELRIRFTGGQSEVSVKVGLGRNYQSSVFGEAAMFAYSDPTPGTGLLTSSVVSLGTGPTPITQTLAVSSATSNIRSVLIRFGQEPASEAWEVIDDLTYSRAGPPCGGGDSEAPMVVITEPATDGAQFHQRDILLGFTASDDLRIAEIEVEFLDAVDVELASFFRCGGGALPCPTAPSFASEFNTQLPAGTTRIRVTARDFFGRSGFDERLVDLLLPGPDFNLWAQALEITQGTQPWLPINDITRSGGSVPTFPYPDIEAAPDAVPLIAGRTTVVRLIANVEGTTNGVAAGRISASLRCFTSLDWLQPCPGHSGPLFPESRPPRSLPTVTVDPAEDVETRRRDLTKTWNFVLPREWVDQPNPEEDRVTIYLEARVIAPFSQPECPGCDDAANRIRLSGVEFHSMPSFSGTLVRQIRIRRERPSTGVSFTPTLAHVIGFVDFIRKTYPVDESTVSPLMSVLTANQEDEDGNVFCDHAAAKLAFPTSSVTQECCDDGFRIVATYKGGDLDGKDGSDCVGGGLGWRHGYATVMLPSSPISSSPVMAQEIGHANGVQGQVPRGRHFHAGPPPGHSNECAGNCSDASDCTVAGERDCNCNGIPDATDIATGTSLDTDGNNVPDECRCKQDSDCTSGLCNVSCNRDWPWPHGITGGFGFDILDFEVVPGDQLECRVPGVCDNGIDDDSDGRIDEECIGINAEPPFDIRDSPHDFMSYGGCKQWVSPRTWTRLFNGFTGSLLPYPTSGVTAPAGAPDPAMEFSTVTSGRSLGEPESNRGVTSASLIVRGRGDQDGLWTLAPAYEMDFPGADGDEGIGELRLELRDSMGQVLLARNFDPVVPSGSLGQEETPQFSQVLPLPVGVETVVLSRGGVTLDQRTRSASAPLVTILSPSAAGFEGEPLAPVARWSISDQDSDPLHTMVQYAPGGAAPWRTIATDLTAELLPITLDDLEGSTDALVRLLVTDGLNTTVSVSAAFTVAGKAPLVEILSPPDGADLMPGERAVARGLAFDQEDGRMDSANLSWSSDLDGALGGGREVDLAMLSPGIHLITLQATDSDFQSGSASITVDVAERINEQPLADAGPDQLAATTAQLDGTGSLDPDGDPLGYLWSLVSQPPGAGAVLSGDETAQPTLSTSTPGIYEMELVVDDGEVESFADTTVIEFCTDADADGACADLVTVGLDCDDSDPLVHPDAPEVNDGQDQQCPGDEGFGLIDEVSGAAQFGTSLFNPVDDQQFHWPQQGGARLYRVLRSDRPDFVGECTRVTTPDPYWVDEEIPAVGGVSYYMVQALDPNTGSWGVDFADQERSPPCDPTAHVLVFQDNSMDNMPPDTLLDMFSNVAASPDDYILFKIRDPYSGIPSGQTARCMERADWYVDNYLNFAMSGQTMFSGNWSKWAFGPWPNGLWRGPNTFSHANDYGFSCFESFAWCVETGLEGMGVMAIRPNQLSICEAFFAQQGGCGFGSWQLTIKIAGDRQSACGF